MPHERPGRAVEHPAPPAVLLRAAPAGMPDAAAWAAAARLLGLEAPPDGLVASGEAWLVARVGEGRAALGPALGPPPGGAGTYDALLARLGAGAPVDETMTDLVDRALAVWARPGFDSLVSLSRLRFTPFPHQLQAARLALARMRGRAILADEVGLGKTIEAGLVLSELYLRRLAQRTLILVPAGLVEQWREELDRKFALPCLVQGGAEWQRAADPLAAPILIASLAAARRAPLSEALSAVTWDLVIVDEAHRLKNPRTASARLVKALRARHVLLLTATPVENRLDDLYQLVNLVRPGHLGAPARFRSRHGHAADGAPVTNLPALRAKLGEVMVRHRRSEVALMLPRRLAETIRVRPSEAEAALYRRVSERVREEARARPLRESLTLRHLHRRAGSSARALASSLETVGWHELAQEALALGPSEKMRALVSLLVRRLGDGEGEKAVVFTAFRDTLSLLAEAADQAGLGAVVYHGGLSRAEKDDAVRRFERTAPLLLTTEAAGEGRNLQFCRVMVNYDVPWNPMQIEQRLGRIHRIGQERDVLLTNLVNRDTIEERILRVLEAKINLFELVVGELDMILGRVDEDFDFESFVFRSYVESDSDGEFDARLERFGDELAQARAAYLRERTRIDELVPTEAET